MPLLPGKSKKAFSHNVAAEMRAGKPQDQAVAIAYSEKGEKHMAEGGDVEGDGDHELMMDHCALECMDAIEKRDKEKFMDSFHVLIADILNKMQPDEDGEM